MAFLYRRSVLASGVLHRRYLSFTELSSHRKDTAFSLLSRVGNRCLSSSNVSAHNQIAGQNAYEILKVSQTSSFAEIKASFRKLAKETHPDLVQSQDDSSASQRFVQILAAYEILSNIERRAHYDNFLLAQKVQIKRPSMNYSTMYSYRSKGVVMKKMEVVEWLKWYRHALNDTLYEKRVVAGSSYFDVLERDFYSAVHAAYFGPDIGSMDLLPECFEAEERSSSYETHEVLHLVNGRELFGMVCLANKVPELSHSYTEKLSLFSSAISKLSQFIYPSNVPSGSRFAGAGSSQKQNEDADGYKDLELYVAGKMVAVATRTLPKSYNGNDNDDPKDQINVYLNLGDEVEQANKKYSGCSYTNVLGGTWFPVGKVIGLGTTPEEDSCFIYNNSGVKTHFIVKHRTLLVKHMHWYNVGDKASVCECRCRRARLPPSKYWLFEPRCGMHDIGGWYVETFGKDHKGRNVLSRRYWDGVDANEKLDKRLHPAMYLFSIAYRTLDLEDAKRRKKTIRHIIKEETSRTIRWFRKLVQL
ncbi:uncharacterized protein LOC124923819 [Impatiens glandulifera]|uniref:uncharacterized protein LOC124923819 n=1 Tax=Impatiens glandulifera TaxID=253017 RepID=UPI001FB05A14|nr:uncharacterized protein LOC124923819 [Impatiens glandulifera]